VDVEYFTVILHELCYPFITLHIILQLLCDYNNVCQIRCKYKGLQSHDSCIGHVVVYEFFCPHCQYLKFMHLFSLEHSDLFNLILPSPYKDILEYGVHLPYSFLGAHTCFSYKLCHLYYDISYAIR